MLSSVTLPANIGRYEVIDRLAAGGMAEILLARVVGPSGFLRPVVIKRILPQYAKEGAFVNMFLDEARIVAGIMHPNVVQVYELDHEGGELFLAMEYLEGESASGVMRRVVARHSRLPPAIAAFIVAEACAGLHAAHDLEAPDGTSLNLVHRDVSPQNLFVTYRGAVKVLDFGIAKVTDRVTQTETGTVKGKFQYMSPEQTHGKPLDRRSDVFALGIVLYELLVGKLLFKRATMPATIRAVCEADVPPPSTLVAGVPAALDRICLRALARRRDERYATAAEMRRDLLTALRGSGASDDPGEALALLMQELFPERIAEKREMLRRVQSGSAVTHVPAVETDALVELPTISDAHLEESTTEAMGAATEAASRWETRLAPAPAPRGRINALWPLAAAALALMVIGVTAVAWSRASTSAPAVTVPAAIPSTSPAGPEPSRQPSEVVVRVRSVPDGARVTVDGRDGGETPTTLRVARGTTPVRVELRRDGFVTNQQDVVPDGDRDVELTLIAIPPQGARAKGATPGASTSTTSPRPSPVKPAGKPPPPPGTPTAPSFDRFE